jgi:hypothetical protein
VAQVEGPEFKSQYKKPPYYVFMYKNGKMRCVETFLGMGMGK